MQLSSRLILNADLADTLREGSELPLRDVLEDLGSALIASVGVDLKERFDF